MTRIKGSIKRVRKIEKDAHTQIIENAPLFWHYTFGGYIPATTTISFNITSANIPLAENFLHSVIISSYSFVINRIYFEKLPEGTILGDFFFNYNYIKQFSLGDIPVNFKPGEYIRVWMTNNDVFQRFFEGSIQWLIPP